MKNKNTINQTYLNLFVFHHPLFFLWILLSSFIVISLPLIFIHSFILAPPLSPMHAMGDNPRSPPTLDLHNLFKMPKTKSLKDVSKVCKTFVHKRHHDKKHNEVILINIYMHVGRTHI